MPMTPSRIEPVTFWLAVLCLNEKCEKGACCCDVDNRGLKVAPADNLGYWQFNNYVIFWTSNFVI